MKTAEQVLLEQFKCEKKYDLMTKHFIGLTVINTFLQTMELYASQFNKPPVYGQRVIDEIEQLRKMANHAPDNEYKAGFLKAITNVKAILNEYAPSPGSVDVEEKHKGWTIEEFQAMMDKADKEVYGLGDSSGSEKEAEIRFPFHEKDTEIPCISVNDLQREYRQVFQEGYNYAKSVKDVSREGEKETELLELVNLAFHALGKIRSEPTMSGTRYYPIPKDFEIASSNFHDKLNEFCGNNKHLVDKITRKS